MKSKLIATCMAFAAFVAFAVMPAAASASPELGETTSPGVWSKTPVGTKITGLNEGNTIFTGGFNVTCSYAHLEGTLTENSGTSIKGTIAAHTPDFTGTDTGGDCTSALGPVKVTVYSELCLATTKTADQLEINGCEGKVVTFSLKITNSVECKYETSKVLGTFTTDPSEAKVTITKQPATGEPGNSFLCPSTGELDMVFNLYTTNGTPLTIR